VTKGGEWRTVAALSCLSFVLGCGAEDAEKSAAPASSAAPAATMTPPAETAAASAQARATSGGIRGDMGGENDDLAKPESKAPQAIPSDLGGGKGGASRPTMLQAVAFDLEGKLSADDVRKTIDESRDKFSRCLNGDSTVSVKAKVMPSGALSDVSVPSSVPNDAKLRDCVVAVLKTLTFPKPKGSEPAGLTLDLALKKQLSF
jgi:hypothetical protein